MRKPMLYKGNLLDIIVADHFYYDDFTEKKIRKIRDCGKGYRFAVSDKDQDGKRHHKQLNGMHCDFKYCPNRQYYNSRKLFKKCYTICREMYNHWNYVPIMITPTVPNCKPTPKAVRKTYHLLTNSWRRMAHSRLYNGDDRYTKKNKGILKGWIEKVEFTYNNRPWTRAYNTINLHLHIFAFVHKSYLEKQGSKYFVPQPQWVKDWRRFTGLGKKIDKDAVFVETPYIKENGKKITISKAQSSAERNEILKKGSKEMSKYISKSVDFGKIPSIHNQNIVQLDNTIDPKKWTWGNYWSDRHQDHIKNAREYKGDLERINLQDEKDKTNIWKKDILPYRNIMKGNERKKLMRRRISKKLTKYEINSVKAFHAIYKGLQRCRMVKFGGRCSQISKEYDNPDSNLKEKYTQKPLKNIIFTHIVVSKFNFKYKDYLDKKTKFNKDDIGKMKKYHLKYTKTKPKRYSLLTPK